MEHPVEPARPPVGQLRELIADDRREAGEARSALRFGPLETSEFRMPMRVKLKRRWRSDRKLRVAAFSSGLVAVALLVLWQVTLSLAPPALASSVPNAPKSSVVSVRKTLTAHAPSPSAIQAGPAAAQAPENEEAESAPSLVTPDAQGLSARVRLQRADLWLDVGSDRGAQMARDLLESALRERPRSAHGHAALAEACLRLRDESCAREAIEQAIEIRPWRAGYRSLSARIDHAFAAQH